MTSTEIFFTNFLAMGGNDEHCRAPGGPADILKDLSIFPPKDATRYGVDPIGLARGRGVTAA